MTDPDYRWEFNCEYIWLHVNGELLKQDTNGDDVNIQRYSVKNSINYNSFRSYEDHSMQVQIWSRRSSLYVVDDWVDSQAIDYIGYDTPATYSFGFANNLFR